MSAQLRQSQITRAVKAMQAAGVLVGRVEIAPDGTVNIYSGDAKVADKIKEIPAAEIETSDWV